MISLIFIFVLSFSNAQGAVYTGIEFSETEKALHLSKIDELTKEAGKCLEDTYQSHVKFLNDHGVTKFYGNRKYTKGWKERFANGRKLTPIKPILKKHGLNLNLEDQMENMSCVDFSRRCLKQGFEKAGLSHQWKKLDSFIPDKIGNRLQHALQALGWKVLYWNPNPSRNADWDINDREVAPKNPLNVWGYNEARYNTVMRNGTYLYNSVDDSRSLVNFGTKPPRFLEKMPFGLGTANGGYHVFLVSYGNAIEAHSTRSLFSKDNLEYSPFNPLETGGGPRWTRKEKYRTGLLVVPPNYLD